MPMDDMQHLQAGIPDVHDPLLLVRQVTIRITILHRTIHMIEHTVVLALSNIKDLPIARIDQAIDIIPDLVNDILRKRLNRLTHEGGI